MDPFADGLVQMAEFGVTTESEIADPTVEEADQFEALTFAALVRNGEVTIPRGRTTIESGSKVIVIGRPESVRAFSRIVAPAATPDSTRDIVIVGGSDIGYHTARRLEEHDLQPRLIEQDAERSRELAEELPGTVVMHHDATAAEFLISEHIDRADAVVAATDSDEKNLLVSLLAENVGVRRTIAVVEEGQYASLFEAVGVDVAINPREATAEEIGRFTQEGPIEKLSRRRSSSGGAGNRGRRGERSCRTAIRESVPELPSGVVIGAIARDRSSSFRVVTR